MPCRTKHCREVEEGLCQECTPCGSLVEFPCSATDTTCIQPCNKVSAKVSPWSRLNMQRLCQIVLLQIEYLRDLSPICCTRYLFINLASAKARVRFQASEKESDNQMSDCLSSLALVQEVRSLLRASWRCRVAQVAGGGGQLEWTHVA